MKKAVVVAGPTATGKTRLGIELALQFDGEIVSADSMQIYRGMDVGTAKATAAELMKVRHHMIDVASPSEEYSVARYVEEAAECCEDILSRGKLPFIVGGTGLYIDSLLSGRDFAAKDSDAALREKLSKEYERVGGAAMLERLREFDPERAALLPAGDKRRIVRAVEIYMLTGETITAHDKRTRALPPRYDAAKIILSYEDRARMYAQIDKRVEDMVSAGLFEEVSALLAGGLSGDCTAMQAIGYKEAVCALRGEISRDEAAEQIKLASRRLAKRQLTWFSRDEGAMWIRWEHVPDFERARLLSTEYLHRCGIS